MKSRNAAVIICVVLIAAAYVFWPSSERVVDTSKLIPLSPTQQTIPIQENSIEEQSVVSNLQAPTTRQENSLEPKTLESTLKAATPLPSLPDELRDMIKTFFIAYRQGNYDFAALVALDAIEISDDHPHIKTLMHNGAGACYENLGFIEMAIEQYQLALELNPEYRQSYTAMRRLDPEFAATHPELPKPERKKPHTPKPTSNTGKPQ